MTDPAQQQLTLDDGTTVHFVLTEPVPAGTTVGDGLAPAIPVARGGRTISALATDILRDTLRPLGPLVQEVHDAVTTARTPPNEIAVTFGVQIGQDLKLGIVNGSGNAHLTVTATWRPAGADQG